jgi:hypothetical protein
MQILYLAIIGFTYVIIASFNYIPGYYVNEYHRYFQGNEISISELCFFFLVLAFILEIVSY